MERNPLRTIAALLPAKHPALGRETQDSSHLIRYQTAIEGVSHTKRSCRIAAKFLSSSCLFPPQVQVLPVDVPSCCATLVVCRRDQQRILDYLCPFTELAANMLRRYKERLKCKWGPHAPASSRADRTASCLRRRTVTAQLSFLLSTPLLDIEHNATDRFMRDSIRGCYSAECFRLLHHTLHHRRPCSGGIPYFGCFGPGRRVLTIGGGAASCVSP